MRPGDIELANQLEETLLNYDKSSRALPGIRDDAPRAVFVEQLVESIRRIRYVHVIRKRELNPFSSDPNSDYFDPLRAAIFFQENADFEEACWMVFLFVHFGKSRRGGWGYAREIYSGLGSKVRWSWARVYTNPAGFRKWFTKNLDRFHKNGPGGFGNHRKFESLKKSGEAISSYVEWIRSFGSHLDMFDSVIRQSNNDMRLAFNLLYESMSQVVTFGRLARFDYLTMVGKLGLAQIEPGYAYLTNATGPLNGARLLFGKRATQGVGPREIDNWLVELEKALGVGMQAIEDSLCNWQKSPTVLSRYRE